MQQNAEKDLELTELANQLWPGAWVEFDKWFDAPGDWRVLRDHDELGNLIVISIPEHKNAREAMKAALLTLLGK